MYGERYPGCGVEEYLSTTYRPDRDYIEGQLRERSLGERPYTLVQRIVSHIFDEPGA